MKIVSLDRMEEIVHKNKSLSWEGWTVLDTNKNPAAWARSNGVFKNNSWHNQVRYELNENGWDLPSKFVKGL